MYIIYLLIVLFIILEIPSSIVIGIYYIRGKGVDFLLEELKFSNKSDSIIYLNRKSELKGNYISKSIFSIIFPYYIDCGDERVSYPILRYSKAYYLVKDRFKKKVLF